MPLRVLATWLPPPLALGRRRLGSRRPIRRYPHPRHRSPSRFRPLRIRLRHRRPHLQVRAYGVAFESLRVTATTGHGHESTFIDSMLRRGKGGAHETFYD